MSKKDFDHAAVPFLLYIKFMGSTSTLISRPVTEALERISLARFFTAPMSLPFTK